MKIKQLLFGGIFIFVFINVYAQQAVTRTYSPKDGLPSTESYSVLTDHAGFIWVSTDAGLSRFNGYTFKNFSIREGLPESTVFKLYEDSKHRMWFTTLNSNLGYVFQDSVYMIPSFSSSLAIPGKVKYVALISSLYVDRGDTLWVGTYQSGRLLKILPPYGSSKPVVVFNEYNYQMHFQEGDLTHTVFGYAGANNRDSTQFLEIDRKDGKEEHVVYHFPVPDNTTAKYYLKYSEGEYILASGGQVYRFNKDGLHPILSIKDMVIDIFRDAKGYLWVSAAAQGVYCFEDPLHSTRHRRFFEGTNITGVALDPEGSYWFTSLEKGLLYMPKMSFFRLGPEQGIVQKRINGLAVCRGDTLAAQSYSGDLYLIRAQVLKAYPNTGQSLYQNRNIAGKVFYTGRVPGFLDMKTGLLHIFNEYNQPNWYINNYCADDKGNLFATHTHFLLSIDNAFAITSLLSVTDRISSFHIDKQGVFWIGTSAGLFSWDRIHPLIQWGVQYPLLGKRTDKIEEDEKGRLWLATRGNGMLIFDKKSRIQRVDEKAGLPSDFCRTILIDSARKVWVGTNRGLCQVNEENLSVTNYSILNELTSGEINDIQKSGDNLLVATSDGVFSYSIPDLNSLSQNPPVFITDVSTQYRKGLKNNAELPYLENHIKLSFLGLSYFENGKMEYAFKLEGADAGWRYTRRLFEEYSNLQPGTYRFVVKSSKGSGQNTHTAVFEFRIMPPFWKTAWFIISVSLFTIGSIVFFFRYSIARVRKKEQERTRIRETIAGLEATALRAQMNPHFIFNAINSIQNFILKNDKKQAHDFLIKFSRLIRNVLEFSKSDFISISDEVQTLDLYIQLEKLRASDRFDYLITLDPEIPSHTHIPSMILQPFVENAILHGLFPKAEGKGKLLLNFEMNGENLRCIIEDNGIGRAQAEVIKSRKQNYHKSVGLSVTAERLELLRKENHFEASSRTEDLFNSDGTSGGTRVTLYFGIGAHPLRAQ
ncbi:MAG: histidine kinase [Bacteroidia bacterium]